jgi:hypothetical protein
VLSLSEEMKLLSSGGSLLSGSSDPLFFLRSFEADPLPHPDPEEASSSAVAATATASSSLSPSSAGSCSVQNSPLLSLDSSAGLGEAEEARPRLVIEQQPAPKSLWKLRKIRPPFRVRALPGSRLAIRRYGPVQAFIRSSATSRSLSLSLSFSRIRPDPSSSSEAPEKIELLNAREMPDAEGCAEFTSLMFSKGSHQHMVSLLGSDLSITAVLTDALAHTHR